jgi:hypothetical protein
VTHELQGVIIKLFFNNDNTITVDNDYIHNEATNPANVPLLVPVVPPAYLVTPAQQTTKRRRVHNLPTIGGVRRNRRKTVNSKKRRRSNKRR